MYVLTIFNFLYYIMFVVSFVFLEYLNNKDTNVLILVHQKYYHHYKLLYQEINRALNQIDRNTKNNFN